MDSKQQIQEDEYEFPYHHLWKRDTHSGIRYFGLIDKVIKLLHVTPTTLVLDIGCGDGAFPKELARRFPPNNIYGIDYSERAIAFAKAFTPHVHFEVMSAMALTYPDKHFDRVLMMELLEHIPIPDQKQIISEAHRVLKSDGIFIITVPSKNVPLEEKHYQHFDDHDFKTLLSPFFANIRFEGYEKNNSFYHVLFAILGYIQYVYAPIKKNVSFLRGICTWFDSVVSGFHKKILAHATLHNCRKIICIAREPR